MLHNVFLCYNDKDWSNIYWGEKMKNYADKKDYTILVHDILNHKEFKKLGTIVHHGNNRLDHSLRVSYYSYKVGKILTLDYRQIARGALLHDFFFEENEGEAAKLKLETLVRHPAYALENAKKYFVLSDLESDIIATHMFPISWRLPKYIESWLVDIIDDIVSISERCYTTRHQLSAAMSFMFVCFTNYLR